MDEKEKVILLHTIEWSVILWRQRRKEMHKRSYTLQCQCSCC